MQNILCPKCDSTLAIDDSSVGQMVQCGSCQNVFKAAVAAPSQDEVDERPSKRKSKRRVEDDDDERPSKRRSSKRGDDDDDEDDDEDRPRKKKGRKHYHDDDDDFEDEVTPKVGNGMATASLVLGIIAIVLELPSFGGTLVGTGCCIGFCGMLFWPGHGIAILLALIGGILGLVSMKKPGGKGAWMAGLILAATTLLFAIAGILLNILGFAVQAAAVPPAPPAQNWNPPQQQPMRPFPQKR